MKHYLFIYGNSGLGRSIVNLIESNSKINNWDEIIFINDFEQNVTLGYKTITFDDSLQLCKSNNSDYIIALGEPFLKSKLYKKCQENNLKMAIINGSQYPLFRTTKIKDGCVIHYGSVIDVDAIIDENTFINQNVSIGHDVYIGKSCVISPNSVIGGFTEIGDQTYIGSGSTIRDRIKIGKNCIIGMGAVVTKDIPDNSVVFGNPAKFIRSNENNRVFTKPNK